MVENKLDANQLREHFLSQPTMGTVVGVLMEGTKENLFLRERFRWIGISGSKARQAETKGVNGVVSDDDMVIILDGSEPNDPLNLKAYEKVLDCINLATQVMIKEKGIIPVYASSIRIEDAQMAIAKLVNPTGLKLRMIHSLIYPSPEAVIAFEPPKLARNLVGQSLMLWGDEEVARRVDKMVRSGTRIENDNLTIGGLDGISDNFRMLRTNRHILPSVFLGPQAVHVLDYSLKWAMAQVVEERNGIESGTWKEIIENFPSEEGGQSLIEVVESIRLMRSQEENVNLDELENLYRRVISLWPVLTLFRTKK